MAIRAFRYNPQAAMTTKQETSRASVGRFGVSLFCMLIPTYGISTAITATNHHAPYFTGGPETGIEPIPRKDPKTYLHRTMAEALGAYVHVYAVSLGVRSLGESPTQRGFPYQNFNSLGSRINKTFGVNARKQSKLNQASEKIKGLLCCFSANST